MCSLDAAKSLVLLVPFLNDSLVRVDTCSWDASELLVPFVDESWVKEDAVKSVAWWCFWDPAKSIAEESLLRVETVNSEAWWCSSDLPKSSVPFADVSLVRMDP